jgi:hypothetical protein
MQQIGVEDRARRVLDASPIEDRPLVPDGLAVPARDLSLPLEVVADQHLPLLPASPYLNRRHLLPSSGPAGCCNEDTLIQPLVITADSMTSRLNLPGS